MRSFASLRSRSRAALVAFSALILFVFSVSAIDATAEWNAIDTIMIGDDFSTLSEQPLYSTEFEISAGDEFNISIPLAGDDWQIDPSQAFEVRFMLMMVSGTNNYNTGSKKIKKAFFSSYVQGVTSPSSILSSDFTEYSYAAAFDPAERLTSSSYFPISGGLPTDYVSDANGIYTGRGYFFDVVVNANAFTGSTPKAIQFTLEKFTTQTGSSTYVFCPYVAVRNIIPTEKDYLVEILDAIKNLQVNGGMSPEEMTSAMLSALEQHDQMVKNEAEDAGSDAVDGVDQELESVIDQENLLAAFDNFAHGFSHSGTSAVLTIPDIYIPGMPGLFDKITLLDNFEYDLTAAMEDVCPAVLLTLMRTVITAGVLYYPVREIMGIVKMIFEKE